VEISFSDSDSNLNCLESWKSKVGIGSRNHDSTQWFKVTVMAMAAVAGRLSVCQQYEHEPREPQNKFYEI